MNEKPPYEKRDTPYRLWAAHPEPVLTPERQTEAVLRNVVAAIASPLRPGAMLACPALRTILLPRTMRLPGAVLCPSPLLLPRDCLLLGTLWLRLLSVRLGTLSLLLWLPLLRDRLRPLLLRLLSRSLLGPLLLRLLLRSSLLSPLLLRLWSRSGLLSSLPLRLLLRSSLLGPLLLRLWSRSGLLSSLLLRNGLLRPLLLRLLLPRSGLLGPLLLWRLLSRSLLRPLLLRLPFGLAFFLRVRRVNRPKSINRAAVPITRISCMAIVLPYFRYWTCTQTTSPPELFPSASAVLASALVWCTFPSGWLGGAAFYFLFRE